jgi:hypothetical protein
MSDRPQILLTGAQTLARALSTELDPARCEVVEDSFAALERLADDGPAFRATIICGVGDRFESICRAARLLIDAGALLAVGGFAEEPRMRELAGAVLDDYFLDPPQREDIEAMHRWVDPPPGREAFTAGPSVEEICRAIRATGSPAQLKRCLRRLVSDRLGLEVRWTAVADLPRGWEILLAAEDGSGEVLAAGPAGGLAESGAGEYLSGWERWLGALFEAARSGN